MASAATATTKGPTISLKLLVDKHYGKVIFAEVGKDFVDFLFGLLELPLGTILALVAEPINVVVGTAESDPMSGSLGCLYKSVQSMDKDYFHSNKIRDSLLRPPNFKPASNTLPTPLLKHLAFPKAESPTPTPSYGFHRDDSFSLTCRETAYTGGGSLFGMKMAAAPQPLMFANEPAPVVVVDKGYVKGVVTYMVMDDLTVRPVSPISTISLLNTLGFKDFSSLEEKTVLVDMDKGLKLLKASFQSTTVLTDVFLISTMQHHHHHHHQVI